MARVLALTLAAMLLLALAKPATERMRSVEFARHQPSP